MVVLVWIDVRYGIRKFWSIKWCGDHWIVRVLDEMCGLSMVLRVNFGIQIVDTTLRTTLWFAWWGLLELLLLLAVDFTTTSTMLERRRRQFGDVLFYFFTIFHFMLNITQHKDLLRLNPFPFFAISFGVLCQFSIYLEIVIRTIKEVTHIDCDLLICIFKKKTPRRTFLLCFMMLHVVSWCFRLRAPLSSLMNEVFH